MQGWPEWRRKWLPLVGADWREKGLQTAMERAAEVEEDEGLLRVFFFQCFCISLSVYFPLLREICALPCPLSSYLFSLFLAFSPLGFPLLTASYRSQFFLFSYVPPDSSPLCFQPDFYPFILKFSSSPLVLFSPANL